jgi:hypothetical protein
MDSMPSGTEDGPPQRVTADDGRAGKPAFPAINGDQPGGAVELNAQIGLVEAIVVAYHRHHRS